MALQISQKLRTQNDHNYLDDLPDDLVVVILSKLASSVSSPPDFINAAFTCRRFKQLCFHHLVLSKLRAEAFTMKPQNWIDCGFNFLNRCVIAGNLDACYTLGMIRYYCFQNRRNGLSLIAKAAMKSHASALYSLAVIQFNGSGGTTRDLRAGVALCARASALGHIDALRELGHCLYDGYGVRRDVAEGRKLLIQAGVREIAFVMHTIAQSVSSPVTSLLTWRRLRGCKHIEDAVIALGGCDWSVQVQPVNSFMRKWFETGCGDLGAGLRMCSNFECGRVETRPHEFRRCSVCGKVNYCSRGCQTLDWKMGHQTECSPVENWVDDNGNGNGNGGDIEMGN